jgi:esterase/lipase superfamily enzyme
MGNYVVENAMNVAWTRKNRPLLMSLINQFVMVAADVDNDLFRSGDTVQHGDSEGIANLTYRVTAIYSGKDSVLGASAGLKHFGKRRLGRSGCVGYRLFHPAGSPNQWTQRAWCLFRRTEMLCVNEGSVEEP